MHRKRGGFTVIEMAVTVTFLGILAAVTGTSIVPLLERRRLQEAAQEVEQIIRKAQQYAIAKDRAVYISFNNPGAAPLGTVSHPVGQSYTLVVGDPCQPDDKTQRLSNLATSDRNALSITNLLPPQINIDLTTFNYGTCPAPIATNDMPVSTNNANIVAFDYQGRLVQGSTANPSNAGKYVQLSDLRSNRAVGFTETQQTYILTQLGDLGTVKVTF